MTTDIDLAWCLANPLPPPRRGLDKKARGKVLAIGGSALVPGAAALTGEAALRVGAGNVHIATIESAAVNLGVSFPEAAITALPYDHDGEISSEAAKRFDESALRCDAIVIGPGISGSSAIAQLVAGVLERAEPEVPVLLDAGAIAALAELPEQLRSARNLIATPHHGELAEVTGQTRQEIDADPHAAAFAAAKRFGTTIVLKDAETNIVLPGGLSFRHVGEAMGLGTAGSGDVLAGVIAGLLARGIQTMTAICWGVWLHGESGRRADVEIAPLGYLARDLLPRLPRLVATATTAER